MEDVVNQPELKPWNLQIVHHDSPDKRGVDVGLIYNPRYFKLENVTNHRLTALPFATRDQMCVVGQLLRTAHRRYRKPLALAHRWAGTERTKPYSGCRAFKHIADSLWTVDPQMGIIIMGDLNDDPMDKSCAVTPVPAQPRRRCRTRILQPWWDILNRGIGTLAYKSSWNLFDQIIVSGNLVNAPENRWNFYEAKVLNFDFLKRHRRKPHRISQTNILCRQLPRWLLRPLPNRNFPSSIRRQNKSIINNKSSL